MPTMHPARYLLLALPLSCYGPSATALKPNITPDMTLHFAGSTIQDNNLIQVLGNICVSGTLDQYFSQWSTVSSGFLRGAGTSAATPSGITAMMRFSTGTPKSVLNCSSHGMASPSTQHEP